MSCLRKRKGGYKIVLIALAMLMIMSSFSFLTAYADTQYIATWDEYKSSGQPSSTWNDVANAMDMVFNEHNKDEFPPAHTAEHLLNQTMIRMFGCERSKNAHIERKKSKISYILDRKPDRKAEREIERTMNELIEQDLPVSFEYVDRDNIPEDVSIDRLPEGATDTIRLVRIGDYDVCPCIGKHVRSTAQIGRFEILGTNWDEHEHSFRIRYKVVQ